jgi:hypothetical protein
MDFLPRPSQAEKISSEMAESLKSLKELVIDDIRSKYCSELGATLSDVYFIADLQKPEAVSAMLVGQLEEFQVRVAKTQETLKIMAFPSTMEAEHLKINELFVTVAKDLRADDNRYTQFARSMEGNITELNTIIDQISEKSADLKTRPQQLKLAADGLDGNGL